MGTSILLPLVVCPSIDIYSNKFLEYFQIRDKILDNPQWMICLLSAASTEKENTGNHSNIKYETIA